jgi:CRP/FNR family cyclic AMP-dependent transcriptional regulator
MDESIHPQGLRSLTRPEGKLAPRAMPGLEEAMAAARKSPWLSGQPRALADALLARASLQRFSKNQMIIKLEEMDTSLHYLLQGAVEVAVPRITLELFPVHIIASGQWFGEHGAITGKPSFAEYRARTLSSTLAVPRAALIELESRFPDGRAAMVELLSLTIRTQMEMAGDLAGFDAENRVRSKLLTLSSVSGMRSGEGEVSVPISQEDLAIVSCVSRPTVCKILRKLEEAGTIRLGYRRIEILRRGELLSALRGRG